MTSYLNDEAPSQSIYDAEDDPDRGKVYGDGKTQWNYLELSPGSEYGMLVQ